MIRGSPGASDLLPLLISRVDCDLVVREVEMGAEKRGDGAWVAAVK